MTNGIKKVAIKILGFRRITGNRIERKLDGEMRKFSRWLRLKEGVIEDYLNMRIENCMKAIRRLRWKLRLLDSKCMDSCITR